MEEKDKIFKQLADDYNEAIAEVRFNMSTIGLKESSVKRVVKARDLAIKALEKQIPKKPIFDYNLSDTLSKFHCECGNTIKAGHDAGIMDNNDAPNYCSDCGQKLDWSEESEEFEADGELEENCDLTLLTRHFKEDNISTEFDRPIPQKGEKYKHFKIGKIVTIIGISRHTETEEISVVYEYEGHIWNRPLEMFMSEVDKKKYPDAKQRYRFEVIK